LRSVTSNDTDLVVTLGVNKIPTGGGLYATTVARSIVGAGDYRSVVRFMADGRVSARLGRVGPTGAEVTIRSDTIVPGLTYTTADRLLVRVQATGTNPTTVRMKVWKLGTTEPAAWTLTVTDATTNLQAPGSTGIVTYLSGSSTNAPVVMSVDDYLVTRP
jgi:hypothetical protein